MIPKSTYEQFISLDIRIGTVTAAKPFPEARKPAYQLHVDFGLEVGILKSSAQITDYYSAEKMIGSQIVAVVNFPPKQIGPFISECLILGAIDGDNKVVLLRPDRSMVNGCKIA